MALFTESLSLLRKALFSCNQPDVFKDSVTLGPNICLAI